ncbi:MAG: dienelactone hydrolase [Alphaproteobacteria bacterium]|nr:dienelactone hydrolase [Alphaproteobacteria bacterium]
MTLVGMTSGVFQDPERRDWDGVRPRPIAWSAWYPAAASHPHARSPDGVDGAAGAELFILPSAIHGAAFSPARSSWPVVLLSHGTGGQAEGLAWLGARLASVGYVCLAVSHHGNTGIEPYRAEGFLCWWDRPRDLTVALDLLASDPRFCGRLDLERVFAAGFSLGGYTVLSLAGAITELSLFRTWAEAQPGGPSGPREFPNLFSRFDDLLRSSKVFRTALARQSDSYADPRVRAVAAFAPAPPVRAFRSDSLAAICLPVALMAGRADLEAPHEACAQWLYEQNLVFIVELLGKTVGHYVFLNEATDLGRAEAPELCDDPPGVDRRAIHDRAAAFADAHFRKSLKGDA